VRKIPYKYAITISGIALLGIVLLQVIGAYNTYSLKRQFTDEHIQMSLHQITHKVCRDSLLNDIELLENEIKLIIEDHFDEDTDESNFQLAILNQNQDKILYSNSPVSLTEIKTFQFKEFGLCTTDHKDIYLFLKMDKQDAWMAQSFIIWTLFSLILIGLVIYSFYYVVSSSSKHYQLNQIKNDFINNMSHELKTPIATMSVASEMLVKKDVIEDSKRSGRYAKIIHDESQRLRNLVDRVLNIAIFENQQPQFKFEKVDIHQLIKEVHLPFEVVIEKANGKSSCHLEATKSTVNGDAAHLTQAITNLIDNAIKYSPDELEVKISSYNKDNYIVIEIEDKGLGIDKKEKERIFEKFHRIGNGDVHDIKGFGIGLYYVKSVIEHHKGKLDVISNGKKGSRFSIFIPIT
jgi:two-component system phosphate regulon sensor histidine kinase PhoR